MRAHPAPAAPAPLADAAKGFSPAQWLIPAAWVYFALVGGTGPGELQPVLRLVNSALGIGLLIAWVRAAPRNADTLDRYALVGLLLFLAAAVMARSPRAALDAALAASAYIALLFVTRTVMANAVVRVRIARWLGIAGVVLAAAYCLLWLLVWSRWLGAGQPAWALFDLPLPAGPYGFKHNVALISSLLIPFLWMVPPDRPGRLLRVAGVGVLVPVLVLAGSRGLWLAAIAATVAIAATRSASQGRWLNPRSGWWRLPLGAGLTAVVVAWLVPDLAQAIGSRVGNLLTVGARLDLWAASLYEWNSAIVTGVGPGGWPMWLPETGYFDLTTFAPRHPDSMPFQLLAETGLLGAAAVVIIVVGVVRALRSTPPPPSIWAVVFFIVACATANPTDLPFAAALGIAWLAIAVPRVPSGAMHRHSPRLWKGQLALLGIIVAVVSMSSWAGILHERARDAASSGDLDGARNAMEVAVALDPGLGLYHRELAALRVADKDLKGALSELQRARFLNPADDITMAGLAVVWSLEERPDRAVAAAARAVTLRRSAPVDHLVLAWVATRGGDPTAASSALADSLVAAPWLTADSAWQALRGDLSIERLLRTAAARSISNPFGLRSGNAVWLAAMSNQPELVSKAGGGAAQNRESLRALTALLACEVPKAEEIMAKAAGTDAASLTYWLIRAMVENASGRGSTDTLEIASLLGSTAALTGNVPVSASAFGARADDQWVYDRVPILLPAIGPALPSDDAGFSRWLVDPRGSAQAGAPRSGLAQCDG